MSVATQQRAASPPAVKAQAAARRKRILNENLAGFGFLAPQLIGLLVFMLFPLGFALVLSFMHWDGFGTQSFAGLENFRQVFSDPRLQQSAVNTVWFTVLQVPGTMISAFTVAFMLQRSGKWKPFYRTFYFAPVVTSSVAVAVIWLWLFNPDISPINTFLKGIGLPSPNWLQDPAFMLPAFAIVGIWHGMGYQVVMFTAGLDNIPRSMLEAAEIDGAGEWQKLWKITLPLLSPTLFFLTITSIITSFQVFDIVFVFMGTNAPDAATTIVYEIVRLGFREFNFGVASALAVCLFVGLLALTGVQMAAQKKWVHYTE